MQYARVRISGTDLETPITRLAGTTGVGGVHLLAGGVADTTTPTYSLSILARELLVREFLENDSDVLEWEISSTEAQTVYAYVHFRAPPAVSVLRDHLTSDSLVVLLPASFHAEGSVELTVVGSQSDLSEAMTNLPNFSLTVLEVGPYRSGHTHRGAVLTDRQRTVLQTAYECGYYETPRRSSHEEIASELGCASSTVGEHLRKAEGRLVASLFHS